MHENAHGPHECLLLLVAILCRMRSCMPHEAFGISAEHSHIRRSDSSRTSKNSSKFVYAHFWTDPGPMMAHSGWCRLPNFGVSCTSDLPTCARLAAIQALLCRFPRVAKLLSLRTTPRDGGQPHTLRLGLTTITVRVMYAKAERRLNFIIWGTAYEKGVKTHDESQNSVRWCATGVPLSGISHHGLSPQRMTHGSIVDLSGEVSITLRLRISTSLATPTHIMQCPCACLEYLDDCSVGLANA